MDVQFVETIEEKKEALLEQVMYLQGPDCILPKQSVDRKVNGILERERCYWCSFYHGGMEHEERMLIQQQFMNHQL